MSLGAGAVGAANWMGDKFVYCGAQLAIPGQRMSEPLMRALFTTTEPVLKNGKAVPRIDNYESVSLEVFRRVLAINFALPTSPITVGLSLLGKTVEKMGDSLKTKDYFYIQGDLTKEIRPSKCFSLFSWAVCCHFGGMPWLEGLPPARDRETKIAAKILENKPAIVVLQQVSFSSKLPDLLKDEYPHIFTRIGRPGYTMLESCLFLATALPVLQAFFVPFPGEKWIDRGHFFVEFDNFFVIATQLSEGKGVLNAERRREALAQIEKTIQEKGIKKPVFLAGDLQINAQQEYTSSALYRHYWDPRNQGVRPDEISSESATCSNLFRSFVCVEGLRTSRGLEIDDYLVYKCKNQEAVRRQEEIIPQMDIQKIPAFDDPVRPEGALSHHHALLCVITLPDEDIEEGLGV